MQTQDIADIAKVAPPAVVTLTSWASGVTLSNLAYLVTIVYTVLMIGNFFWTKLVSPWLQRRKAESDPTNDYGA